ncbi:unnamed protein product [Nezara viridula]|uniref:Uncharacterized protein n=1 Tax=Nezara viridula TaxID=85310 RepID=A0A9P0H4P9_NEZVI|nr:unnamed protein product [Nezara viridula]
MDNIKAIASERLGIIAAENEERPTDVIELIERSLAMEAVSSEEEDKEVQKLVLSLLSQHMLYEGIPHDIRPTLSRIPYNFRSRMTVKNVNEALSKLIIDYPEMDIEAVCHWAYVAARVVIIELGLGEDIPKEDNGYMKPPRWQRRLENKIASLRPSIGKQDVNRTVNENQLALAGSSRITVGPVKHLIILTPWFNYYL